MIGNDIIDFSRTKKDHWRRPRLLEKLFSENEKAIIFKNKNPDFMLWLLWSMKESAYKANQRRFNLKRETNPLNFECFLTSCSENEAIGMVFTENEVYHTQSFFDFEKMHSIASISVFKKINYKVFSSVSEVMKTHFLEQVSESKNVRKDQLEITYNMHGVPQVFLNSEKIKLAFSFSGHGKFSAFAFG